MKLLDKVNIAWGAFTTLMTALLGEYWFLFLSFLVLNIVDYVTGLIKARMYGVESSAIGAKGIVKKVSYWIVVGIAFFMAFCFAQMGDIIQIDLSFMPILGWFTLATYIINELRSILENCVQMGITVPSYLTKGLDVASRVIADRTGGANGQD